MRRSNLLRRGNPALCHCEEQLVATRHSRPLSLRGATCCDAAIPPSVIARSNLLRRGNLKTQENEDCHAPLRVTNQCEHTALRFNQCLPMEKPIRLPRCSFLAPRNDKVRSLCTLNSALCTPHSALCTLHSALCTPHSAFCTLHSALCTLHSALRILHSALCTLHSAFCTFLPQLFSQSLYDLLLLP